MSEEVVPVEQKIEPVAQPEPVAEKEILVDGVTYTPVEYEKYRKILDEKKKALAKLESFEKKALEEQGKYKELYEKSESEKQIISTTINELKTRSETYENEVRNIYLEQIPKDKRENYKAVPIDILKQIAKDFAALPQNSPGAGGGNPPGEPADLDLLSEQQQYDLMVSNPATYNKLLKESRDKRLGIKY